MAATPPPTLTTMRALAAALIVLLLWSGALASPAPLLENLSLDHYSAPGPYHMAAPLMVDAPKASAFRQSYGYAPVAVYFPTDNPGGTALADPNKTPDGTFHVIGFAHGAGSAAEFYTGLYAHLVSHGFIVVSVRNMAPVPATLGDDMCHGLAWILAEGDGTGPYGKESMFYGRIGQAGVGTMGHSMGGGGSIHCAMSWPQRVRAVAPIHPAPGGPATLIYSPMMVAAGALDYVTSPLMVKTAVFDGSPSPKIMPIMSGVAHREPVNYAGANRWNGYLTAFMSLYLRRDFRAALLVWGEETGSMARDTRIGVAHRNKGSVLWLESAEAVLRPGAVTSIAGRVTKTLPSTMAAPHELRAYKRIGEGFDVDVGFEVKSQNDHEISFVLHISVGNLAEGGGFPSRGGDQKLTVAAVNANDGGSSSFHDVFLSLDPSSTRKDFMDSRLPPSRTASVLDNQVARAGPSASLGRPKAPHAGGPAYYQDGGWVVPVEEEGKEEAAFEWEMKQTASGTTRTEVGGIRVGNGWASVLYESSEAMQKRPDSPSLESLGRNVGALPESPYEGLGGWDSTVSPASSVPPSLLPWGAIVGQESGGVVLGVADFPAGYGDARAGKPTPRERELLTWINAVRSSPETFEGAYAARGCKLAQFSREERTPKLPLHLSPDLATSAARHSGEMAAHDFVSHVGRGGSTPFDRMDSAGYDGGYRGENICAGMAEPLDCVASFMCSKAHRENVMSADFREIGAALSSDLASQYQHYWTVNLGHRGVVRQGEFVSSFESSGQHRRTLSVGSHRPEEPIDEVVFSSAYHDTNPPRHLAVVANGVEFPLDLEYGAPGSGVYQQRVQLVSIPMAQVLKGAAPCVVYHFAATARDGRTHRFPELGSYGFGACDFDDERARWVGFQNDTRTTVAAAASTVPRGGAAGVCLTDLHRCADGTMARRVPPSCQFHCGSGDPPPRDSEVDFLQSNGPCASTAAQFFSGIFKWCPEALQAAYEDPNNAFRWLVPLWREIQRVDWVAAANALTKVWQNMERCETYRPGAAAVASSAARSEIRVERKEAISSARRVIVRADVADAAASRGPPARRELVLSHREAWGSQLVSKRIVLARGEGARGESVFDDFAEAPAPGWWGSWIKNAVTGAAGGRRERVRRPEEALMHFTEEPLSSSAGVWELSASPEGGAAILDWEVTVCGEPLAASLNFTGESSFECKEPRARARHPLCAPSGPCDHDTRALRSCGSVSVVGGASTQPPPPRALPSPKMGSILRVMDKLVVQPSAGSSVFCSTSPRRFRGFAAPTFPDGGLEVGLYLFHHSDPHRENGAWRLEDAGFSGGDGGRPYAVAQSLAAKSGCFAFYVVSTRGAGPYDFWLE